MHPGLRLDARERLAWREQGFFVRPSVFAPAEVEVLGLAAERAARRAARACAEPDAVYEIDGNRYCEAAGATVQFEHRAGSATLRVVEPFHHLDPRLDRLVDDPRLVGPARELVGDRRVALFTDKLNLKRPREGSGFRWHQDSPYWAHFCAHLERLPNVLLALDDASEANGCFRVIPGSHRRGLLPGRQGEGVLGPLFTDPRHFDEARQLPLEVPAGSLVFFSAHLVHGSGPNRSRAPRRACVITYQPGGHRMFKVDAKREVGPEATRGPAPEPQPRPSAASRKARRSSS